MICNVASYKFSDAPLKATYGSKCKVSGLTKKEKLTDYLPNGYVTFGMQRDEPLFTWFL